MKRLVFIVILLVLRFFADAHPMPGSVVNLYVLDHSISGEAKIPLAELETAIGKPLDQSHLNDQTIFDYFRKHIQAKGNRTRWLTQVDSIVLEETKDPIVGKYVEVKLYFQLIPSMHDDLRHFIFNYDAVIHQIITHKIIVFVQQDWYNGVHEEKGSKQIGVIEMDPRYGVFQPLSINLEKGSWWKGFSNMIKLGSDHIKEGIDHLLFLIILLLPSFLIAVNKRWTEYGGLKYTVTNLLKIITAFTIGHSLTLFIAAKQWVRLPQEPVELLIAISILISAIHAYRPVFYKREIYVAGGFGLIHGLAFASVLANLKLSATMMLWSILGFNVGIEITQLLIVLIFLPFLFFLIKTPYYRFFRVASAIIALIVSFALLAERSQFLFR